MNNKEVSVSVVIVTYNRKEKLKKSLELFDKQLSSNDSIVVVNNNSNDGTKSFLDEWSVSQSIYKKRAINNEENLGGSGGFYTGQKFAMTLHPDWIYCSDDDAYPDGKLIANFKEHIRNNDINGTAAIATMIRRLTGEIEYGSRSCVSLMKHELVKSNANDDDYIKSEFDIDLLTYVGVFLNCSILSYAGLCNPKLFIYYDDSEHCLRLKKYGRIICVPKLLVWHEGGMHLGKNNDILLSWREYYFIRNEIYMLKKISVKAAFYLTYRGIRSMLYRYKIGELNIRCVKLILTAIGDGWFNRLGKHSLYFPNFCIERRK